jgi:hypothetical protein
VSIFSDLYRPADVNAGHSNLSREKISGIPSPEFLVSTTAQRLAYRICTVDVRLPIAITDITWATAESEYSEMTQ